MSEEISVLHDDNFFDSLKGTIKERTSVIFYPLGYGDPYSAYLVHKEAVML